MVRLLDVNVLLALTWPIHMHHDAAHAWFASRQKEGWATCPSTEAGFVRISSQPAVTKRVIAVAEALLLLGRMNAREGHRFWPQAGSVADLLPELASRVMGPQQLMDALLLDLAIRNDGVLATFDKRIEHLLPPGSAHRERIEVVPIGAGL
jgi:toxin-antitoxin system PIN domain toxin